MAKVPQEDVTRYADMLAAMGTEPRLRIMRLLLAAHLDAAFDQHLLSFTSDGRLVYALRLSERAREVIQSSLATDRLPLDAKHETFMTEHRERTLSPTGPQSSDLLT